MKSISPIIVLATMLTSGIAEAQQADSQNSVQIKQTLRRDGDNYVIETIFSKDQFANLVSGNAPIDKKKSGSDLSFLGDIGHAAGGIIQAAGGVGIGPGGFVPKAYCITSCGALGPRSVTVLNIEQAAAAAVIMCNGNFGPINSGGC